MALDSTLREFVFLLASLAPFTHRHYAQSYPSIYVCLASQVSAPAGGTTESPDCALRILVSFDQRKICLSFVLVHQAPWAWCRNCCILRICGSLLQSWATQIPAAEQQLWVHQWCFWAAHLLLLPLPLGLPRPYLLTVKLWPSKGGIHA